MSQENPENLDPEMLDNLDLLLNMDVLEREEDWEVIEDLDEESSSNKEGEYET